MRLLAFAGASLVVVAVGYANSECVFPNATGLGAHTCEAGWPEALFWLGLLGGAIVGASVPFALLAWVLDVWAGRRRQRSPYRTSRSMAPRGAAAARTRACARLNAPRGGPRGAWLGAVGDHHVVCEGESRPPGRHAARTSTRVDWATVAEMVERFPEVEESREGRRAWRVRGKLFAWQARERDGGGLGVRVDRDEKQLLLDANPEAYFSSPHYDGWPGIQIRLERIGRDELFERLEDAWLIQAPKRLARAYLESSP